VLAPIVRDIGSWRPLYSDGAPAARRVTARLHIASYARSRTKRLIDIVAALFLLTILTIPALLIVAPTIFLTDRGPVFFRQRRVGRDGRDFSLLKFRTMTQGAENQLRRWRDEDSALWREYVSSNFKLRHDPRTTGFGRFLRRFSIDEWPQLLNVLRGEMSLVGPRPMLRSEIPEYGPGFLHYCGLRPGITGLWQIRGRSEKSFEARARYDGLYFRRASLGADLRILANSAFVVLWGSGAF
jgi:lipopolysaccharide/colanic/teichoic acid biosynthesis glycosyltransferase